MITTEQLLEQLRSECKRDTQQLWAEVSGFSAAYVSDVLNGRREVSPRIASILGFERVILWRALATEKENQHD